MDNLCRAEIDMAKAQGRQLWRRATKGLNVDDRCDLSQAGACNFKESLDEPNSEIVLEPH